MRSFLASILGTYTAVTYQLADGTSVIPAGLAGVDWLFVLSGVAFLLVMFCVLRILGGLICKIS